MDLFVQFVQFDDYSEKIYHLILQNGKHYIGWTNKPLRERVQKHIKGEVDWTRLHGPIKSVNCGYGTKQDENELTIKCMFKYGWDNVRGGCGTWCSVEMKKPPKEYTERIYNSTEDDFFNFVENNTTFGMSPFEKEKFMEYVLSKPGKVGWSKYYIENIGITNNRKMSVMKHNDGWLYTIIYWYF